MKHTSQSDFGRPVVAVQSLDHTTPPLDKWELLAALTEAAEIYELNHRTLGVLKALLTFWPERTLPSEPRSCIVFPSNRTLSLRLNGMPESTLRRHLARLVSMGIVDRHDSANHKRFARRRAGAIQQAYGFDLSPLARHSDHVLSQASAARELSQRLLELRDQVAILRQTLLSQDIHSNLVEQSRQALRRKPNFDHLTNLATTMRSKLEAAPVLSAKTAVFTTIETPEATREMISNDGQNERHLQDSIKQDFDSEEQQQEITGISQNTTVPQDEKSEQVNEGLTIQQVLAICPEVENYFPGAVRCWEDLQHIASRLTPMLGIDQPVFTEAKQRMGHLAASISVLCILQRSAEIRSPGAYLRRLAQKASLKGFSVMPMLNALRNREEMA